MVEYLTQARFRQLQRELFQRKNITRKEILSRLKEARELGDLSENAAYKEAKDAQAENETAIYRLEHILANARILKPAGSSSIYAKIGSRLTLQNIGSGRVMEILLVSSTDVNPRKGQISINSPLGKACLGKKAGETIIVEAREKHSYKIISIT